jgi:hypothetical protein
MEVGGLTFPETPARFRNQGLQRSGRGGRGRSHHLDSRGAHLGRGLLYFGWIGVAFGGIILGAASVSRNRTRRLGPSAWKRSRPRRTAWVRDPRPGPRLEARPIFQRLAPVPRGQPSRGEDVAGRFSCGRQTQIILLFEQMDQEGGSLGGRPLHLGVGGDIQEHHDLGVRLAPRPLPRTRLTRARGRYPAAPRLSCRSACSWPWLRSPGEVAKTGYTFLAAISCFGGLPLSPG